MPVVATTLKNTNTRAVVRLIGDGAHTITRASLITKATKSITTTSGSAVVTLNGSTLGVVVGGTVVGANIPVATTVVSINQQEITLSAAATGTGTVDVEFDSQVSTAATKLAITEVYAASTGLTTVERAGVRVLNLHGDLNWQFDGFSINDNSDSDIAVNLGAANSTLIVELKKDGYGDNDHPYRSVP